MFFRKEFMWMSYFLFFFLELKMGDSKPPLPLFFSVGRTEVFKPLELWKSIWKNTHFKNQRNFSKPVENQFCVNSIWLDLRDYMRSTGVVMRLLDFETEPINQFFNRLNRTVTKAIKKEEHSVAGWCQRRQTMQLCRHCWMLPFYFTSLFKLCCPLE